MQPLEHPEDHVDEPEDPGVAVPAQDPVETMGIPELTEEEAASLEAGGGATAEPEGGASEPGEDEDEGGDRSFDLEDVSPETESVGENLSPEDLARIEAEREEAKNREHEARREVEKQLDEEGRQRRQNVRVNVHYPITLHATGFPTVKARCRDLSATGVGFATRLPLENEAAGTVTIHFPEWNFTKEFVVRFVKPILAGKQCGAQFRELTEDERERLVKEVFAVQRSQLQEQRKRAKGV